MSALDFSGVLARSDLLAQGVLLTAEISAAAIVLSLAIGMLVAALSRTGAVLRWIAFAYVEVIRNTPFIVQVFVVYFGLPVLGVRLAPIPAAIVAMVIYGGAYMTEIVRAGLDGVEAGQVEAAQALGLGRWRIFRHVVLKPALAAVFPSLCSQAILLLLSSSVVSAISVPELTGIGNDIQGMTLRNMEIYLVIAGIYVLLVLLLRLVFQAGERVIFAYRFQER